METKSKQVKQQIKAHILECVYDENENQYQTLEDAKERLLSEFDRVAGHEWNLRRFPNNQDRFSDYLSGIPFHFEYTNHGIIEYLNGLGINPNGKGYDTSKSMRLYHYLIFRETQN